MTEEQQPKSQAALLRWSSWFYLALAVAGVLWLGLRSGAIPLELFCDRRTWLADVVTGVGAAAVALGLWQMARRVLPSARSLEHLLAGMIGPLTTAEIITLAGLSGFSEELFFRGAVQSQWGIVPATLVFALLHMGPGKQFRLWGLFALVAGAGLGGLMIWRGNLLAPTVAHGSINLVGLARLSMLARRSSREASE